MQIALVRHGRPRLAVPRRIAGHELRTWIDRYDEAGIDPGFPPPAKTLELATAAACIVTSTLRRSIESARALAPARATVGEAAFREAGLPSPTHAWLRLSPQAWGALTRIAWFLGWCPNAETLGLARERAAAAAAHLVELFHKHGPVLLVGHAVFNRLIAAELRRSGWRGPALPSASYWKAAVYQRRAR